MAHHHDHLWKTTFMNGIGDTILCGHNMKYMMIEYYPYLIINEELVL